MNSPDVFAAGFSATPYWLDDTDTVEIPFTELPSEADLVVIGSGYTGLHAALVAGRAGRHVVVLEAAEPGAGCSTRNGGQISPEMKATLPGLSKRYGREQAVAILREGYRSVDWLGEFIAAENIACDYTLCGSFHGAHSARHFAAQARQLRQEDGAVPSGGMLVEPDAVSSVIGTKRYHGGVVYPGHGCIHPARYHAGLLRRVLQEGVQIHAQTPALELRDTAGRGRVKVVTSRGVVQAGDVIVATNGYTGGATPWLQRRVVPVGSYMIATEPLSPALIEQLMPTDRIVCDTRKVVYYYRLSPDRRRIIFGGRVSARETDPLLSAPKLHQALCFLFPALSSVRISHSWMGYVAFTFDSLAKFGKHDNVHYAMGYCGSGIASASYYGMHAGNAVIGNKAGHSALYNLPFSTRPFYTGNPWFLGATVSYYQLLDRLG